MANVTYKVVKGDTLSEIAVRYNTTVNALLELNPDIPKPGDLIYVGQTIIISGSSAPKTTTKAQKVKITNFGLQAGQGSNGRLVFATWAWGKSNTDHYDIEWQYLTGNNVWFITTSTVTLKQSTYTAPENAVAVRVCIKPVSKTYKSGNSDVHYWVAARSTMDKNTTYYFSNNPPGEPAVPTVTIESYKLTAKLDNQDINANSVQFQIVRQNGSIYKTGKADLTNGSVTYTCTVAAGEMYKVRCRATRDGLYSDWTNYSDLYSSSPAASEGIYLIYANSAESVTLQWYDVPNAQGYEVQYATSIRYFDTYPDGVQSKVIGSKENPAVTGAVTIGQLTAGVEYFFRVRSVTFGTTQQYSAWSEAKSVILGSQPSPPTTWSSASTVKIGEPLTLYWTHNATDNSRQTAAKLDIRINENEMASSIIIKTGKCETASDTYYKEATLDVDNFILEPGVTVRILMTYANTVSNPVLNLNSLGGISIVETETSSYYWNAGALVVFSYDGTCWRVIDNNADQTNNSYSIDTTGYADGATITWSVKTAGIAVNTEGEPIWSNSSVPRVIKIYAPPEMAFNVHSGDNQPNDILSTLPVYVSASVESSNQRPVGYHLAITSLKSYETVDNLGNPKLVSAGEDVYSKYFNDNSPTFNTVLTAGDLSLENNGEYRITLTVSMDSGLTGEESFEFSVAWADEDYWPMAEIGYDPETYSAFIRPFCTDENGDLVEGVTMSVYRREFDGSFTKLEDDVKNTDGAYITDPHPALDYARYRIVAVSDATGVMSYYDMPGYPIGEKAVIIQWNEKWSNFDVTAEERAEQPAWSGSLVKLPYNIDILDSFDGDVEHINYIGRNYPVSYHGTQVGHTSTWNMEVPKYDAETRYALKRLGVWMGNVYVRSPSGAGYWATVSVSMDEKHCELTVPVKLSVTRVEGGA